MYRINSHRLSKLDLLLKQDRKIFHTKDLGLLWQIQSLNTLYTAIKRYVQKGILIPIHKGLYSTLPLARLDPVELGVSSLHRFSYLSAESVLVQAGIINQTIPSWTLISSFSKRFSIGPHSYLARKLQDRFLYQTSGLIRHIYYNKASPERAVADLLYFNPFYHFDADKLIDWRKVHLLQKEIGYR